MALIWGVEPLEVDAFGSSEAMVHMAVDAAKAHGKVATGDLVLVRNEAAAIVRDPQPDALVLKAQSNQHLRGASVANGVPHRLLRNAQQLHLRVG